jgi:hypothetical protein
LPLGDEAHTVAVLSLDVEGAITMPEARALGSALGAALTAIRARAERARGVRDVLHGVRQPLHAITMHAAAAARLTEHPLAQRSLKFVGEEVRRLDGRLEQLDALVRGR